MRILACLIFCLSVTVSRAQSYYLLIGTYTNLGSTTSAPPKDSTGSKGIYLYKWDASTGKATFLSHTTGIVNPSFLAVSPDRQHIYACTDSRMLGKGSLAAFKLDKETGTLKFINKVPSGGDNPVYVSIHKSGRWAAIANYTGGSLSVFPIRGDGAVLPYVQNFQHIGHSINPQRQEKAHVHSVIFSPDNMSLYAQDLGEDSISIYGFVSEALKPLTPNEKIATTPGSGPRHLALHPNGRYIYLIEEMGGSVDAYRFYPGTGHLQLKQRIAAHPEPAISPNTTAQPNAAASLNATYSSADIHISPDGRFLYASNRGAESNIAIFAIDPDNGTLKSIGYESVLGKEPRNFMIDPTGQFLLVGNQTSNEIIIFRIDKQTGLLHPTGEKLDVPGPSCLQMVQ